ncbi:MAG: hypothetical protein K9H64_02165 [Bacteroidales bacterium]|nr:hypothetical protein [Bacteroidales bacterium]MCF8454648.1 hypothetical protein [Bacteroidales bacterium]
MIRKLFFIALILYSCNDSSLRDKEKNNSLFQAFTNDVYKFEKYQGMPLTVFSSDIREIEKWSFENVNIELYNYYSGYGGAWDYHIVFFEGKHLKIAVPFNLEWEYLYIKDDSTFTQKGVEILALKTGEPIRSFFRSEFGKSDLYVKATNETIWKLMLKTYLTESPPVNVVYSKDDFLKIIKKYDADFYIPENGNRKYISGTGYFIEAVFMSDVHDDFMIRIIETEEAINANL